MLEALVRGDWIAETLANIANAANEHVAHHHDSLALSVPLERMQSYSSHEHQQHIGDWEIPHKPNHQTNKALLFNDPSQQQTLEIPAQTPCLLVRSVELAKLYELLVDPIEVQFAKSAVGKGLQLVWLQGRLRHLSKSDIEPLPPS